MDAFWNYVRLLQIDLLDAFEITVVAVLIYRVLILWSGTRAFQMLFGLVLLVAVYAAAGWLSLDLIESILSQAFTYGAFALIVVFHPELRNALARIGRSRVLSVLTRLQERSEAVADEIAKAAAELSRTRTGAIIAIERELSLEEYIEKTGTRLRADVSSSLLESLFTPKSPLHDGAVVVRDGQIVAAGVHLPLTQYPLSDRTLGTRHRATLGLSEETDAYVVVVSEETSQISLARRGVLRRNLTAQQLRDHLAAGVAAPELSRPGADPDAESAAGPDGTHDVVTARDGETPQTV
ncbi:diadenylate cyclase CdaA [Candidatus Palauibacter sp.]|uniref:diadenylate cyclase CdaA n=1 Tax=Candidatus Palauibacter sp. TaxID=3101350 RepID=UPI003B52D0FF